MFCAKNFASLYSLEIVGACVQPKPKNNPLAFLTEFMPLILVVGLLVLGWLMWQMYGSMSEMYTAVQSMQSQLNTLQAVQGLVLK